MFRTSFKAENPKYWMNRLEQDETMKTCQQYRDNPPRKIGEKLEKLNAATIRYPVDGKLIGDWKEGEKLAAVGTGGHIGFIQPDRRDACAAATATPATNWPRRKSPTAPSAPACIISARSAAPTKTRSSTPTKDLQLQRLLGLHQHAALRPAQLADAGADHPPSWPS